MIFPAGVTVTVRQRAQDQHGDRTTTATYTVPGCALHITSSAEKLDARDDVTVNVVMAMPAGTPIAPTDQVVLPDGAVYEVNGQPSAPVSPFTGWAPGVLVPLQLVTG